jgi:hypothetical protein
MEKDEGAIHRKTKEIAWEEPRPQPVACFTGSVPFCTHNRQPERNGESGITAAEARDLGEALPLGMVETTQCCDWVVSKSARGTVTAGIPATCRAKSRFRAC